MKEMDLPEDAISLIRQAEWPSEEGHFAKAIVAPDGRILVAEPGTCVDSRYCWNIYGPGGEFEGDIDMVIETLPMFMGESELGVLVLAGPYLEHEVQVFELNRK
jgi:hypothetical protein